MCVLLIVRMVLFWVLGDVSIVCVLLKLLCYYRLLQVGVVDVVDVIFDVYMIVVNVVVVNVVVVLVDVDVVFVVVVVFVVIDIIFVFVDVVFIDVFVVDVFLLLQRVIMQYFYSFSCRKYFFFKFNDIIVQFFLFVLVIVFSN